PEPSPDSSPPASARRSAVSSAPPSAPARESKAPAWFEDRQDSYANFLHGMASGEDRAGEMSVSLAKDPKTWLTKLVEERDGRITYKMLGEVEGAARLLAQRSDSRTLRAVSSTVHGVATDESRAAGTRARAAEVMKVFADPALLAPIAERLLAHDDDHREAGRTLVLDAGTAGAYALYGARVKGAAV